MKYSHRIGIDVAKNTLEVCILEKHQPVLQIQVANNQQGIQKMIRQAQKKGIALKKTLFCLESTGMYAYLLLDKISQLNYSVVVANPLTIKRSMGMQRGKNDQVDALRIAQYAYRLQDELKLWEQPRDIIQTLHRLQTQRESFVKIHQQITQPLKEGKIFFSKKHHKILTKNANPCISGLQQAIKAIDTQIKDLIDSDAQLNYINK